MEIIDKNEELKLQAERFELAFDKIKAIATGGGEIAEKYSDYFVKTANFIIEIYELRELIKAGEVAKLPENELAIINQSIYSDILPLNYEASYGNPTFAVDRLGEEYGQLLSMLYTQIRAVIAYAYEGKDEEFLILMELFIQVACLFAAEVPAVKEIKDVIYWFFYDYSDIFFGKRAADMVNVNDKFTENIIRNAGGDDLRYLYSYGEYISDNELKMARFIWDLPEAEVRKIAETYANGFLISFEKGGKDRSIKNIANMRFHVGTERIVSYAMDILKKEGFDFAIYRHGVLCTETQAGYDSANPNQQFYFDHSVDMAAFLDKNMVTRALDSIKNAFEKQGDVAKGYGGPVCLETFGETPFTPKMCKEALKYSDEQRKIYLEYNTKKLDIINKYTVGEHRSFTIMALPVPEIGENYKEIFEAVCELNTLDYQVYENIQQVIIDALNKCDKVHIRGMGENKTDLTVNLFDLTDPAKQTIFENCVADVNIPVGEVFTSPKLSGTDGELFVGKVYLDGLLFENLSLIFKDGRVVDYNCSNYENEEEAKKYVLENVLNFNENIAMGEFAIGTNTTAYAAGKRYNISGKYPILIAEKTGPHFAVGDTCYSHEEDQIILAPDGKEVVAKENEVSALRKTEPDKAYFGWHMDVTIPYDELDTIIGITADGTKLPIISGGRFVLPGTEELNKALDE